MFCIVVYHDMGVHDGWMTHFMADGRQWAQPMYHLGEGGGGMSLHATLVWNEPPP